MSGRLVGRVLREAVSDRPQAVLLLVAIAERAGDDGRGAYPSLATLAAETRLSRRSVMRLLAELEASGDLAILRQPGKGNSYLVTLTGDTHGTGDTPGTGATDDTGDMDGTRDMGDPTSATGDTGPVPPVAPEPFSNRQEPDLLPPSPPGVMPDSAEAPDHLVELASASRGGRPPSPDFLRVIDRWANTYGEEDLIEAVRAAMARHEREPWDAAVTDLARRHHKQRAPTDGQRRNGSAGRGAEAPRGSYAGITIRDTDPAEAST